MALAHYAVRAGLPVEKYTWLERYRDYMIEHHGCENWETVELPDNAG